MSLASRTIRAACRKNPDVWGFQRKEVRRMIRGDRGYTRQFSIFPDTLPAYVSFTKL